MPEGIRRITATLPRVTESHRRGVDTLRRVSATLSCPNVGHLRVGAKQERVSAHPSLPQIGASKGLGGERQGYRIPFHAPAWGIGGSDGPLDA